MAEATLLIEDAGEERPLRVSDLTSGELPAEPVAYRQLSVSAPQGLGAIPEGATAAIVVPEGPIRWRHDAIDPSSTVGMLADEHEPVPVETALAAFRIAPVSGTVEVNIHFYRRAS